MASPSLPLCKDYKCCDNSRPIYYFSKVKNKFYLLIQKSSVQILWLIDIRRSRSGSETRFEIS